MKTPILARLFIKNYKNVNDKKVREAYVMTGGIFGIICNLLLFLSKLFAGIISGSVSIIADAFNNLSDMGSSVVSMLGVRMSMKPADRDHPFGHGRMEYMSAFVVSALIILVGFELLKSSVSKMLNPAAVEYSTLTVIILIFSITVKFVMFAVNRSLGKAVKSGALSATAQDSVNDCIVTGAILLSIPVSRLLNFNIDPYVGAAVSLFILYSGFMTAKEALDPLLGTPPEKALIDKIISIILKNKNFIGVHDLIVHNYGPGRMFASVHVEVPSNTDMIICHEQIDLSENEIYEKTGVQTVIHMDPIEVDNPKLDKARESIRNLVFSIDNRLTIHDFRMTPKTDNLTNLIFDVVVPNDFEKNISELRTEIADGARRIDSTYCCVITFDNDFT